MDNEKFKELTKLVSFCRKNGITHIKSGDLELDLSAESLFPESEYKKKKNVAEPALNQQPQYTEEEVLLWSAMAPGIEETN